VPALLYGNIIEVSEGRVAIEEGCSGIRSFQVSLMLALFFGDVYELSCARRVLCVIAAVALSLLTNLLRTVLLTLLTAKFGMEVMSNWHDRGGVPVLVALFLGIWVLASWLRSGEHGQAAAKISVWRYFKEQARKLAVPSQSVAALSLPLALLTWLGFVEVFTEAWYRSHEKTPPASVVWRIEPPREDAGFRDLPFSKEAHRVLRFDEGLNATWTPSDEIRCQAIFLSWKPGGVTANLARNHTPEDCLIYGGYKLVESPDTFTIYVHGLELPFRSYKACGKDGLVYAFYCLWEDRATQQSAVERTWLTYRKRLASVLEGRRNSGQRSLEIALWGAQNEEQAKRTFTETLNQIIKVAD
jgi:exosortase/archaeosortase family protein